MRVSMHLAVVFALASAGAALSVVPARAQQASRPPQGTPPPGVVPAGVTPPPGYLIGVDDQLSIVFWKDKDLTTDVVVRPDGLVSLPLLNDVKASGLTPDQLRDTITEAATKYVEDPTVTVVVKQINSRKVFITGQVAKPGVYPLTGSMTLVQLVALAGGLGEYADSSKITVVRGSDKRPDGTPVTLRINYKDLMKGQKVAQNNVELKPGDTVMVP